MVTQGLSLPSIGNTCKCMQWNKWYTSTCFHANVHVRSNCAPWFLIPLFYVDILSHFLPVLPSGQSAARYPRFVQPLLQVLCGYKRRRPSETLHQRSSPASYGQRPGKGSEENQDGSVRVGGLHVRTKERHRCRSSWGGHVRKGGGKALPTPSPPHPQTYLHAFRQASTRTAIPLLPRQGAAR